MAQLRFWLVISVEGLVGALVDILIYKWSKESSASMWVIATVLIIAFITGMGYSMRIGAARGYPMTAVVLVVLATNISAVGLWDLLYEKTHFSSLQWLAAVLITLGIFCFELGRKV